MTHPWVGQLLLKHGVPGKPDIFGRVIYVSDVDDVVVLAPPPRVKKNGHVDNYFPSPKWRSYKGVVEKLLPGGEYALARFETPAHWLWTEEQLRGEVPDGTGLRRRYNVAKWVRSGERAYEFIRPFVEQRTIEQVLLDPELSSWLTKRGKALPCGATPVRRALNAYLFGLGNKRVLLPWYPRCGAPGKRRVSKTAVGRPSLPALELGRKRSFGSVTEEMRLCLALGWKRFKTRGVSVRVALDKTRLAYFVDSVEWDGADVRVTLKPEAFEITEAMFRYWGQLGSDGLTAQAIERGETPAKRTYLRRQGTFKGRDETLNGRGFLDSTSCDQTLRSTLSPLKTLQSPWRTEVLGSSVDYVFGLYVGFEAPSARTALLAILSAASDKVDFCRRYGHTIEPRDWLATEFKTLVMDNGEGKGQLVQRTLEDVRTSASYGMVYDALNKSPSESNHRQRQKAIDHLTPGSTMGRRKERGEANRSDFAVLLSDDYMHLLIKEILFKNNEEYYEPPRIEMYSGLKERTRRGVVEWLQAHHYMSSAALDLDLLRTTCLPRLPAVMHGDGLHLFDPLYRPERLIPQLVYRSDWLFAERHLQRAQSKSWRLEAWIDPGCIGRVWVNINGLRPLDLCANDPDLANLSLMEWLAICHDNRLLAHLANERKIQHGVEKVAAIDGMAKAGRKAKQVAISFCERKPSKAELRSGKGQNTAIEAALISGIPKGLPMPAMPGVCEGSSVGAVAGAVPSPATDTDDLLALAVALYNDRA